MQHVLEHVRAPHLPHQRERAILEQEVPPHEASGLGVEVATPEQRAPEADAVAPETALEEVVVLVAATLEPQVPLVGTAQTDVFGSAILRGRAVRPFDR